MKKEQAGVFRQIGVGFLDSFNDLALDFFDELFFQPVSVEKNGAGSMMGMGTIDKDASRCDSRGFFNLHHHGVEIGASDHKNVAGDDRQFPKGFLLQND